MLSLLRRVCLERLKESSSSLVVCLLCTPSREAVHSATLHLDEELRRSSAGCAVGLLGHRTQGEKEEDFSEEILLSGRLPKDASVIVSNRLVISTIICTTN